jgi:hypothetical protein
MSTDPQVLKYLSAIAREVGEFRQDFNSFRNEANGRLDKVEGRLATIEREQRQTRRFMDRVHGLLLMWSSEAEELRDRVETLEEEKT